MNPTMEKLMLIVIAVVVAFLIISIFYPESGFFGKAKKWFNTIKEGYLPKITLGTNQVSAGEISLPPEQEAAVRSLRDALERMAYSRRENCFAQYEPLPPLTDTQLELNYDSLLKKTEVLVSNVKGQVVKNLVFSLEGVQPCVIAGSSLITQNFVWSFFEGKELRNPYFYPVPQIRISYNSGQWGGLTCNSGNHLTSSGVVGKQCNNLEDNGWLFKPDAQHVCFLPTNYQSNYDIDGIDNDYLKSPSGLVLC